MGWVPGGVMKAELLRYDTSLHPRVAHTLRHPALADYRDLKTMLRAPGGVPRLTVLITMAYLVPLWRTLGRGT